MERYFRDEFIGYNLTASQRELVTQIEEFLKNDAEHVFILKGYAATGKELILKGLENYLRKIERGMSLVTPTNKTAFWLDQSVDRPVSTIHSMIYEYMETKESEDGQPREASKFIYRLRGNLDSIDHVYVIGESSLLNDEISDCKYLCYGTGKLLEDLMNFIDPNATGCRRKVIFIGDDTQMAPGSSASSALTSSYFKAMYGDAFPVRIFQLTNVVDEQLKNLILNNAVQIRHAIEKKRYNRLVFERDASTMIELDKRQFLPTYVKAYQAVEDNKPIIVASMNQTVKLYNAQIREQLFPGKTSVQPGDWIMFTKNVWIGDYRGFNGEFAKVLAVKGSENKYIDFAGHSRELRFRYVDIEVTNRYGEKEQLSCELFENLLDASGSVLPDDEWLEPLINTFYYPVVYAQYGYAITVHKAQGGVWNTVFFDTEFYQNIKNKAGFKWLYTGLTLAKDRLYFTNWTDMGSKLLGTMSSLSNTSSSNTKNATWPLGSSVAINGKPTLPSIAIPDIEGSTAYREYVQEVSEELAIVLSQLNIQIVKINNMSYRIRYTFRRGNSHASLDALYNGKQIITSVENHRNQGDDENLANEIQEIMDRLVE
ncbi:MAG: ATP-binding domain-containing protein [Veillonella sp.]|nr:ATP-binding domain-containing protein [Veillonella sp.]